MHNCAPNKISELQDFSHPAYQTSYQFDDLSKIVINFSALSPLIWNSHCPLPPLLALDQIIWTTIQHVSQNQAKNNWTRIRRGELDEQRIILTFLLVPPLLALDQIIWTTIQHVSQNQAKNNWTRKRRGELDEQRIILTFLLVLIECKKFQSTSYGPNLGYGQECKSYICAHTYTPWWEVSGVGGRCWNWRPKNSVNRTAAGMGSLVHILWSSNFGIR